MQYIAVGDKFIAKKIAPPEKTSAGVLLPTLNQKQYQEAEILDVDPNFKTVVKVGDKVRYMRVEFDYGDIIVVRENNIACIVKY